MSRDIRWLQRFDNFSKACARLLTITDTMEYDALSELEKEGLIQRFEYTFELAWKVARLYAISGVPIPDRPEHDPSVGF